MDHAGTFHLKEHVPGPGTHFPGEENCNRGSATTMYRALCVAQASQAWRPRRGLGP